MLNVNICGIDFKNPLIMASGTFGFGREHLRFIDITKLGGISSKGLTLHQRDGNNGIRCFETASGVMNSVGLENPGIQAFIDNDLGFMLKQKTVVLVNLGGGSVEEYVEGMKLLNTTNAHMIELNISCPNVTHGGMAFGIKSDVAAKVVKEVRSHCDKPLVVKLSPNAEDIVEMAVKCVESGADAISLVNTFKAMAVDVKRKKPVFDNVTAGLSGPAIKPIALRMVYEVSKAITVPVIGMGGIMSYLDVLEFIMCGAHAVEIGTANLVLPNVSLKILSDLEDYLEKENIKDINDLRGTI